MAVIGKAEESNQECLFFKVFNLKVIATSRVSMAPTFTSDAHLDFGSIGQPRHAASHPL